jgi:hypothetical protein
MLLAKFFPVIIYKQKKHIAFWNIKINDKYELQKWWMRRDNHVEKSYLQKEEQYLTCSFKNDLNIFRVFVLRLTFCTS